MMTAYEDIKARLQNVRERIDAAAERARRDPSEIRLVVVTKGHPVEKIRVVIEAGARILGENYADHAEPKIREIGQADVEWHMIGHVQSRKSHLVAANFQMLHSLDSVKLARRLQLSLPSEQKLPVLLQLNVSGETQKSGIPAWGSRAVADVQAFIKDIEPFDKLDLQGLMTIPPFLSPAEVRPYFKRLADLRDRLESENPGLTLPELSMGMSGDFEAAVEEGATLVRVGTAVMGPRIV